MLNQKVTDRVKRNLKLLSGKTFIEMLLISAFNRFAAKDAPQRMEQSCYVFEMRL